MLISYFIPWLCFLGHNELKHEQVWCCKRAAPKITSILLCWLTTPEADVGGIAVEVEPFHQHSATFCCCVTDGNRGALWQSDVWHTSVDEAKVRHWITRCRKNGAHWHSPTLLNIYGDQTVDLSTVRWWVAHFSGGDSSSGHPVVQIVTSRTSRLLFITGGNG